MRSLAGDRTGRNGSRWVGGAILATVVVLGAASPAPAARVIVRGAPRHVVSVCGEPHVVTVRRTGRRLVARVAGGARGRRVVVSVARCEAGRWKRLETRRGRRGRVPLDTRTPGDYRIRVRKARAAYARLTTPAVPGGSPAPAPSAGDAEVVDLPVTFRVTNQNRSRAACSADGADYEVKGHLVAPRSVLAGDPRSVTVYMHNIGWGSYYWHFQALPGYDYATELARAGHASLVYDNLDYGASGRPAPTQNCYGSQADVASQVIAALRKGSYAAAGAARAPAFGRVALAAHSIGSLSAEPESYSFKDADALIVTSWADQTPQPSLLSASGASEMVCARGGDPAPDGSPSGYASFSAEDFKRFYFANADPRVADAAAAMRSPIPCGEPQSAFQAIATNRASLGELTIPILLVYGRQDALFPQPDAGDQQKALFTGSSDVTEVQMDGAGQALALERTAPAYRRTMSDWLSARGF